MGGEDVVVVKAGGAAVLHQLAHTREGGEADHFAVQILPDLVQSFQPVKQLHILHLGQIAGEDLIQVVVRIHKAGVAQHVAAVNDPVGCGVQAGADLLNKAVLAQHIHVVQHAVIVVTGDELGNVLDKQGRHGLSSFNS